MMNHKRRIDVIEKNSKHGQFHVFADEPFFTAGEWTGQGMYITTFHSLGAAVASASKRENGKVYNLDGKLVYPKSEEL